MPDRFLWQENPADPNSPSVWVDEKNKLLTIVVGDTEHSLSLTAWGRFIDEFFRILKEVEELKVKLKYFLWDR